MTSQNQFKIQEHLGGDFKFCYIEFGDIFPPKEKSDDVFFR